MGAGRRDDGGRRGIRGELRRSPDREPYPSRTMATPRLTLRGELDAHSAPELRARLHALIDEGSGRLIVDLAGVTFLDSTILGLLVGALRRMRESGGELLLVYPPEPARRIFAFTGLERVFRAADDG